MYPNVATNGGHGNMGNGGFGGFGGGGFGMMELIKTQIILKMFSGGGSGGSGGSGDNNITTLPFILFGYDMLSRNSDTIFTKIGDVFSTITDNISCCKRFKKQVTIGGGTGGEAIALSNDSGKQNNLKKIPQATMQFIRSSLKTVNDNRIEAIIYHVCHLVTVKELRFNGIEFLPNFKEKIELEEDVWFELLSGQKKGGSSGWLGSSGALFGAGGSGGPGANSNDPSKPAGGAGGTGIEKESIEFNLITYAHNIQHLHSFIDEAMKRYEQDKQNRLGSTLYFFDQITDAKRRSDIISAVPRDYPVFIMTPFTTNRSMSNVFFEGDTEFTERLRFFKNRKDWYDQKGIPYTFGVAMMGPPGCGKTSTQKAISAEMGRHIFNISLSQIRTKRALKSLFYDEKIHVLIDGKIEIISIPIKSRINVIEDIDAMESFILKKRGIFGGEGRGFDEEGRGSGNGISNGNGNGDSSSDQIAKEIDPADRYQLMLKERERLLNNQEEDKTDIDLSTMLNILDGIRETPGRIIIISTNDPASLDPAFLRPGRFDIFLTFKKHSTDVLQRHIEAFYDCQLNISQRDKVITHWNELNYKWTPAEVAQVLFNNLNSIDKSLQVLIEKSPKDEFKYSYTKSEEEERKEGEEKEEKKVEEDIVLKYFANSSDISLASPVIKLNESESEPEPEPKPEPKSEEDGKPWRKNFEKEQNELLKPSELSNQLQNFIAQEITKISSEDIAKSIVDYNVLFQANEDQKFDQEQNNTGLRIRFNKKLFNGGFAGF